MTQSIPAQSEFSTDEDTRHRRLMELVAAEDASNGEVGCGGDWGSRLSGYLSPCPVSVSSEFLRNLLQEHLGTILMEPDFDSITTQIQRQIETLAVLGHSEISPAQLQLPLDQVTEHVPTAELKTLFQPLREFCSDYSLEQLIQLTHQIIHKAVSQPRHTWSQPIWVLRGETQIYIAQAADIEAAIDQIKTQHPQERGALDVVTVGGILAPDQVIALDRSLW